MFQVYLPVVKEAKELFDDKKPTDDESDDKLIDVHRRRLACFEFGVHEKIKPFACNHCGYVPSKRGNLNQHVRNIHPKEELPFPKANKTETKMEDKEEVIMVEVDINSELGLEARVVG